MFNKILSSIGIGSAKVDTHLDRNRYIAGEELTGLVTILGGKVEQQIDNIYLSIETEYLEETNDNEHYVDATLEKYLLIDSFIIQPGERREIPFSFTIPIDTPITNGNERTKVWIETGLDIKKAIDPNDRDYIAVLPTPEVAATLDAVKTLGFQLREKENKEAPTHIRGRLPFIQEFEFVPRTGPYRGLLDEIELLFFPEGSTKVEVIMQVDRRARGLSGLFAEALDMDESFVRFSVSGTDVRHISVQLQNLINRYANK